LDLAAAFGAQNEPINTKPGVLAILAAISWYNVVYLGAKNQLHYDMQLGQQQTW
jgi:hypothetical protein